MHPATENYRGLWRRRLLRDGNGEDRETQVWWLQGDGQYVDLRIPPDRPDFTGVSRLDQCSDEQLSWLARQQGFAGQLSIEGDRLHWQRAIDFQPPAALADIGAMHWDGACLHEQGVLADYAEEWLWQRPATATSAVGTTPDRRGLRLVVGDWFMQAVDRREPLPPGTCLAELIARASAAPASLLDCAIDFGRVEHTGGVLRVLASTLPWREGHDLTTLDGAGVTFSATIP